MTRARRARDGLSFGGNIPWGVGLLLALTIVPSMLVAFGGRHGAPLLEALELAPAAVWRGQVWRLVPWPLLQTGPISLIFACVAQYWFGRDIADETGSPRFLAVFASTTFAAAVATCLVGLVDPSIRERGYVGGWSLTAPMIIAWGLWFPQRVIRIYFVLPVRGYWVAWLTVGVTVVFAAYLGWEVEFPTLAAEAAIVGWLYFPALLGRWRAARARARKEATKRERARKQTRAVASAQAFPVDDEGEPPPLPAELEARMSELLRAPKQRPKERK